MIKSWVTTLTSTSLFEIKCLRVRMRTVIANPTGQSGRVCIRVPTGTNPSSCLSRRFGAPTRSKQRPEEMYGRELGPSRTSTVHWTVRGSLTPQIGSRPTSVSPSFSRDPSHPCTLHLLLTSSRSYWLPTFNLKFTVGRTNSNLK